MVYNPNGKSYLNKFKYQTVTSYCYLGGTIKYSGSIGGFSNVLMDKGRKASFKIKKSVGLNNPCSLLENLFATLVVPVIL